MTTAIIFSRDRAAQLSILLESMKLNLFLFDKTIVFYKATSDEYRYGYEKAIDNFPWAVWVEQTYFQADLMAILEGVQANHVCFLTDDDVFLLPFPYRPFPEEALNETPELISVSMRLGKNTTYCYPMRESQDFPPPKWVDRDLFAFEWRGADYDFGYPASLDGNVWRKEQLLAMIAGREFGNPNELEDLLVKRCNQSRLSLMGCYQASTIVNIPINRVNTTHRTNRYGETFRYDEKDLNDRYLGGAKISIQKIDFGKINAAHVEIPLVFDD